ncbi:MAG: PAS domain S-box protein [Armatimonadetes bacterium]|nr:PAS domain S-box protein [Armatimonadota bacterium]
MTAEKLSSAKRSGTGRDRDPMARKTASRRNGKAFMLDEPIFRRATDSSIYGVAVIGLDRRIIYVNEARARLHGRTPAELVGQDITSLSSDPERTADIVQEVMEKGVWEGEIEGLRADGSTFPMHQTITRIDREDGSPTAILSVTRDVSDEKEWQISLERRTKQLMALLYASRQINSTLDTQAVMRMLVEYATILTSASGGCAGLLIGDKMVFRECSHHGKVTPIDYSFRKGYGVAGWVMENKRPYFTNDAENDPQVARHIQKKMGFTKLINVPIIASDGRLLGCFEVHNWPGDRSFTHEDVDLLIGLANQAAVALTNAALAEDLRQSAATIKKNEETLRLVVEGSPDFFFYIHDPEGVFTYVSPSVEQITGHSVAEWMSHYTRFLTDNPINEDAIRYTERTLATGEAADSYPIEIFHKNGSRIMLEVYERPIFEEGKIVGIRGVARDITELCRAEMAERAAREEAERRMKSFYRDTILSVTDGKLEILEPDEIEKLCASPVFPEIEICDARDVGLARAEVRKAAEKAGMQPEQVDSLILCVGEAATNSFKHGGGGRLALCDEDGVIRVKVSDSGPGMDSLALPKIAFMKGFSTAKSLGMGYASILALADKVYLSTSPKGTTVVIEVAKQPKPLEVQLANLPDLW